MFYALIGLVLAAGVIVPPVYVHETDRNYEKLFPILSYGREYLEEVTNQYFKDERAPNHQFQTQNQFPIDEVAASTIEELDRKNDLSEIWILFQSRVNFCKTSYKKPNQNDRI